MTRMCRQRLLLTVIAAGAIGSIVGCGSAPYDPDVRDEAARSGRSEGDFPTHPYDAFRDMDAVGVDPTTGRPVPLVLTENEFKGRNTWLMWTGGNHAFWDHLARHSYGLVDFLTLLDNRHVRRRDRFARVGVMNEPGMQESTAPSSRWGLWLDIPEGWRGDSWPPDPTFAPDYQAAYPEAPDPAVYGYSSGVVGLRLFPNPDFFEAARAEDAQRRWDGERFMTDLSYAKDPDLVRPFRVGMACAFCHVAFNPLVPPTDPEAPAWVNLVSNWGAQYYKFGQVFGPGVEETNILWHLINYPRPGTLDTSLLATDGNNNPNTMNSVFSVPERLAIAGRVRPETVSEASARLPVLEGLGLPGGRQRQTPRILAEGADSIGARGALARVWLNIGEFHEEWIQDVNLMVGLRRQRPFKIAKAQDSSVYWRVSLRRTQNLAAFFLKSTAPKRLEDAAGGSRYLSNDTAQLERGKEAFATHCFVCHSSKQPDDTFPADGTFWDDPSNWRKWLANSQYLERAREIALEEDFLDDNYLSTDQRYPVTDIGINMCRSLADNGKAGRVWEDFTSDDYKSQPVLTDRVVLQHPYHRDEEYGGWAFSEAVGPGRVRPLTLASIWATAPFLHNNSVGQYPGEHDPANLRHPVAADVSVEGRLQVFNTSINQLLGVEGRRGFDSIGRTTVDTRVELARVVVLDFVDQQLGPFWRRALVGALVAVFVLGLVAILWGVRRLRERRPKRLLNATAVVVGLAMAVAILYVRNVDVLRIGHIPAGTPVNLIFNLNSPGWLDDADRRARLWPVARDLAEVTLKKLPSLDHEDVPDLVDNLLALNKCPDFVLDRGHTFGAEAVTDDRGDVLMRELEPQEKRDLIEFLKTM